ncbi:hypothetical protein CEXT_308241, partial [Caerostris extrusa]
LRIAPLKASPTGQYDIRIQFATNKSSLTATHEAILIMVAA